MSQARSRRRKGLYVLTDRKRLAVLLVDKVEEGFGGNQRAAARAGLGPEGPRQRLLSRLIRCKTGAITENTKRWLESLLDESQREVLAEILLSPEARMRLLVYKRWIDRALASTPRTDHLEALLRRKHPDRFTGFDRFLEKRGYVEVLKTPKGKKRPHGGRVLIRSDRAELAFREALAPLRRGMLTGKIERELEELEGSEEVGSYLEHSFRVQQILLKRPSDLWRAQSIQSVERLVTASTLPIARPTFYGPGVLGEEQYDSEEPERRAWERAQIAPSSSG